LARCHARVIDLAARGLVDGGSDGPNDAEDEPLLNVEEEVTAVLFLALLEAGSEVVVEVAEVADASDLRGRYHLRAVNTLDVKHLDEVLVSPFLQVLTVVFTELLSHLLNPHFEVRLIAKLINIHVDHTSTRDSGWGSDGQVLNLE
jgi:hypothetical protein